MFKCSCIVCTQIDAWNTHAIGAAGHCPRYRHRQVLDDPEELVVPEILELWAGDVNLGAVG